MAKEFIVYSATKEAFQAEVEAGTVDMSQIGVIADTAEVWINGQYLPLVELSDYLSKAALSVEPIEQKFTWRVATDDRKLTDSLAVVNKIIGNKVEWRQLIDRHKTDNPDDTTVVDKEGKVSVSYSGGTFTITNSSPRSSNTYSTTETFGAVSNVYLQIDHKYLIVADAAHKGIGIAQVKRGYPTIFTSVNSVFTASYNVAPQFAISKDYDFSTEHSYTGDRLTITQKAISFKLNLFDLTEMFGAGYEPSSLGQFRKLYPRTYYAPCTTSKVRGIIIDSFASPTYNLWNKDEAVQGAIMYGTGWLRSDAYYKNWWTYIMPVSPNTRYYLKDVANRSQCMPCVYFDEDMKWVGYDGPQSLDTSTPSASGEIVTPDNASYMAVMVKNNYQNSACVSVSSRRNGDYESYNSEISFDEQIRELFPYGLLEGGGVFDEVGEGYALQRVAYDIDNNGNPTNFRQVQITNSAGNKVNGFNYYPLDNRLWMTWRLRRGGTEHIRLDDVSAPFRASISYALDVNDLLPAPLEDKRDVYMKILAMDENGETYRSANYARSDVDIDYGSEGYIPDCKIVKDYVTKYVSENNPTTVATAPVRNILSSATSSNYTFNLRPNVINEQSNSSMLEYISIYLLNPSDGYAQTWTLRLIPSGVLKRIAFDSAITIKWVNGAPPTGVSSAAIGNVLEIVIRQFSTFYIGEWKVYKS